MVAFLVNNVKHIKNISGLFFRISDSLLLLNVNEYWLDENAAWLECFQEKPSWWRNEHVCQGGSVTALSGATDWIQRYKTYFLLNQWVAEWRVVDIKHCKLHTSETVSMHSGANKSNVGRWDMPERISQSLSCYGLPEEINQSTRYAFLVA